MSSGTIDAPVKHALAVVEDTVFPYPTTGLYVGTGGDVEVIMLAGNTVIFPDVPGGIVLPIRITQVVSTNTTATGLVRLWN